MTIFDRKSVCTIMESCLGKDSVWKKEFLDGWDAQVSIASWLCAALYCLADVLPCNCQKDDASVKKAWKAQNETQKAQALWTRHVIFYVSFMSKIAKKKPLLLSSLPIFGPKFIPPAMPTLEFQSHKPPNDVRAFYLKPLVILHPFYTLLPPNIKACPTCREQGSASDISWCEWNPKGPRHVHGISKEEFVMGYQFECKTCAAKAQDLKNKRNLAAAAEIQVKWSTTKPEFWSGIPHWQIPGDCHFLIHADVVADFIAKNTSQSST